MLVKIQNESFNDNSHENLHFKYAFIGMENALRCRKTLLYYSSLLGAYEIALEQKKYFMS